MPQRIRDFGLAALALGAVFTALALIDERVPEYVKGVGTDVANGRATAPGSLFGNALESLSTNPALDNYFVFAMVAVGAVLLLLMVRT
jgi:hypothetical protein